MQYCQNNPKNSYKKEKLSINLQDTHGVQYVHLIIQKTNATFIGEKIIEKLCKDLKELGMEIINFKKKEMIPLTNKDIKSYEKQNVCYIYVKNFFVMIKIKKVNMNFIIK